MASVKKLGGYILLGVFIMILGAIFGWFSITPVHAADNVAQWSVNTWDFVTELVKAFQSHANKQ